MALKNATQAKKAAPKTVAKKIVKRAPKPVAVAKPRKTRTITETVADAKVHQPSAGKQRLPRKNRVKKVAKKALKKQAQQKK